MSKWLLAVAGVGLLAVGWWFGRPAEQGPWTQYQPCPNAGDIRNAQGVCGGPFSDLVASCPAGYVVDPAKPMQCQPVTDCPYGYAPDPQRPGQCTIAPGFTVDTSQIDANNAASDRRWEQLRAQQSADERARQQLHATEAQTEALNRIEQDLKR